MKIPRIPRKHMVALAVGAVALAMLLSSKPTVAPAAASTAGTGADGQPYTTPDGVVHLPPIAI